MEGACKPKPASETAKSDDRSWMIDHFEARLHELMRKGAHNTRPNITERYENDLMRLYRTFRADGTAENGDDDDE